MRKNTITIVLEDADLGINLSIIPQKEIPETGELTDAERAGALVFKLLSAMSAQPTIDPTNN